MSDVTVAPQGSAPPAAPSNEVPINESPVSTPNPIGSQAPDKPVGDIEGSKHRPLSRREALQAAFDRAENPPSKTARPERVSEKPAPADARKGHNQPPEETPDEKLDLKKRPADQAPRERGEGGRFAPREQSDNGGPNAPFRLPGTNQQQPAKPVRALPETAPFRDPPPRFSEAGKADWHYASENVRADVYRMHREFDNAYQQYRGAHEAFAPIAHFHEMAQAHGTTLERALTNYVGMEQKLRQDVIGGLDVIVNNLGLTDPQTGQRLGLRDVAYTVLSQSPEQLKQVQMGNHQQAASQQIGSLHQEIAGLKDALYQMHTAQQFTYTRSQVDQFADSHPRFDELGTAIEQELRSGYDLETAYRRAELLYPATHAAQTRTSASAQTRPIDRSISGAPAGPSNGTGRRPDKPVGRREAISNAIKRVQGAL